MPRKSKSSRRVRPVRRNRFTRAEDIHDLLERTRNGEGENESSEDKVEAKERDDEADDESDDEDD